MESDGLKNVHLVVGGAPTRVANTDWLDQAGIGFYGAEPDDVLRLDPVGICGMDGWSVRFRSGPRRNFAGVVLIGAAERVPWLDPGLLDWEAGRPRLVAGVLAPGLANLYLVDGGSSARESNRGELLVSLILAQAQLDHPLVDELMRFVTPSHERLAGRAGRRLERRVQRRLGPPGPARSWWEAARDLDGPLTSARGA